MEQLKEIINLLFENIPDGSIKIIDLNGIHVNASNENGHLRIEVDKPNEEMISKIKEFQDIIEKVDDCLFLELINAISEDINLQEFDRLLKQEYFTVEDTENISYMMSYVKNTLCEMIDDKVDELYEIRDLLSE